MPPMYSALKVGGKKLYELAREGKTIERNPRDITIYEIKDIQILEHDIFLRVSCSKGTYIRTLCHDIGERLGCGAHMTSLIREKTGHFDLENSLKIDEVRQLVEAGCIEEKIMDLDSVFLEFKEVMVGQAYNKELYNGNKIKESYCEPSVELEMNQRYRIYDHQHHFIGIYRFEENHASEYLLKPVTLFL